MFTKNFNLSDSLIETAAKLLEESSKKASKNPSSTNHEENMTEASNEEPNINHLELSEEELKGDQHELDVDQKVNEEQLDEFDIKKKVNRAIKRLNFSFIGDKPKDIVKQNKALSDKDVKSLHKSISTNPPAKNSPAELQKKVLDREMIKRKLSNEELNELSSGTMKSYVKKVAATPAGQVKPSREKGIEMASKKLRNEEDVNEEPIDEISRGLASRYISKAKATDPEKRNKGIGLALQKKYGDKKYGTTEPKVKATEEEVMPKGMSMKERTAFHMAAAAAAKQGKPHFEFGGKKFKTTMQKDVAQKMTEARKMKLADYDDSDEDPEGGSRPSEHIMNQLRKASMTMKKEHPVKYSDGKTGMVDRHVAKALVNHYNSLSKAHQKETMQSEIGKSHKHLTNYHDRLHESMYDPTIKNKMKTLVEKKPKKLDEVPVETMKQVKMVHQEEEQVKHKEVIDPNTDKTVEVKHRKPMDPNTDKSIQEREMTPAEKAKREKIVMALKKKMSGFKDRYGERAKDVMYATATKQAMKEEDEAAPKGKTMTGEKKDGVNVKPEMINRGSGGIKSTTT